MSYVRVSHDGAENVTDQSDVKGVKKMLTNLPSLRPEMSAFSFSGWAVVELAAVMQLTTSVRLLVLNLARPPTTSWKCILWIR